MWPYPWTHVGTPSHLGHMDRVAATMPSQAHAGAAQEAPDIGQWEGQDVPLVRPSSCNVKGGIPSSRRYLPTYLGFEPRSPRYGPFLVLGLFDTNSAHSGFLAILGPFLGHIVEIEGNKVLFVMGQSRCTCNVATISLGGTPPHLDGWTGWFPYDRAQAVHMGGGGVGM